jgi:pSer/pThr/pTyr-binding forkhead associated (FHA) protein
MKRPPVIVVQLVHILGPLKGEIQEFSEEVIPIGRHSSCLLRFPPDLRIVSRKHAEIVREGARFKLIDHSANGTFVNGKRLKEVYLKNGDVLAFGATGPKVSFLVQVKEGRADVVSQPRPPEGEQKLSLPPEPPPTPSREGGVEEVCIETVQAPLAIQYGPTLRSFKTLPIRIGRNPGCDLALDHHGILDQQAQIFFSQNQYWVRDLTGQRLVQINRQAIDLQSPLKLDDILSLGPQGPNFHFIGEGRLVEITEPSVEEPVKRPEKHGEAPQEISGAKAPKWFKSVLKKLLDR